MNATQEQMTERFAEEMGWKKSECVDDLWIDPKFETYEGAHHNWNPFTSYVDCQRLIERCLEGRQTRAALMVELYRNPVNVKRRNYRAGPMEIALRLTLAEKSTACYRAMVAAGLITEPTDAANAAESEE